MLRNLFFAGLLTLQIVLGTCDETILIEQYEHGRIDLKGNRTTGKLQKCTLETNTHKVYSIYPNEGPGEYTGYETHCAYSFREIDLSYAGLWTMTTITDNEQIAKKFKVRIKRKISTIPANSITAYAGQWVKIGLNTNETDVRSCIVTIPHSYASTERNEYNLMTDKLEGVSLEGLCGIRFIASEKFDGQWEFKEEVGEHLINHAMFRINVPYEDDSNDEITVAELTWTIGEENKRIDFNDRGTLFCQITKPNGDIMPAMVGSCELNVPVVSDSHRGKWRATYATYGKMELQSSYIVINVKDRNFLECSSSKGANGEINVLCKTGETDLKFCTFIRPDKTLIHLPAGVGNDNYSYYGNGYEDRNSPNRDYAECGVTIHKPSNVDFGVWTCEMGLKDVIRGSVINVVNPVAGKSVGGVREEIPTIFVKRGNPFKINCKATGILSYCWLTSPNGTAYSITSEQGSGKALKYDGKGFAMGECGAIVPISNVTDSGAWTCHMGFQGGFEVEQTVPVKVTESTLVANKETVNASEKTSMACRAFNSEDGIVKYCRWVRPNGHGINKIDAERYELTQEIDRCSLTILDLQPEDIGNWTCFAALSSFADQEGWATVEVKTTQNDANNVSKASSNIATVMSIVLGSSLLIITIIGAFGAALFVYRRRYANVKKDPPPYYAEKYVAPEEIRTVVEPLPNKDNRF